MADLPQRMPALTIWQPWASLIAAGAKPYEFRRWAAPFWVRGRRIAIHAGARKMVRDELQDLLLRCQRAGRTVPGTSLVRELALPIIEAALTTPGRLPLASILCTAVLGAPFQASRLAEPGDSDRVDHEVWAWPLSAIERVEPYVPARGAQGFWWWRPGAEGGTNA